jgi:hypothetical protein
LSIKPLLQVLYKFRKRNHIVLVHE